MFTCYTFGIISTRCYVISITVARSSILHYYLLFNDNCTAWNMNSFELGTMAKYGI